jgi:hypothetical protein
VSYSTKFNLTSVANLDITPEVRSKLSRNSNSVLVGSDLVIRTPLGKSLSIDVILDKVDSLIKRNRDKLNDVLYKLEMEQRVKVGPRSIQLPWSDIKDDFLSQYSTGDNAEDLKRYPVSKGISSLRPTELSATLRRLKNSTSSGLPSLMRKGDIKASYTGALYSQELLKHYPSMMYIRTQEQKKTRIVWGFPMSQTVLEASYFFPLLDIRRTLPHRSSLLGPDAVARRVTEIIKYVRTNQGYTVLSMDFTAYDRSVRPRHIRKVFSSIKGYFQPNPKYYSDLDSICDTISNISMVTPDGIQEGTHGLSSGSVFTNDVGSEVQKNISDSSGLIKLSDYTGDDSIVAIKSTDVAKYFKLFEGEGFKVNRSKTYDSKDFSVYLQNLFHYDYIRDDGTIYGIYPIYRALNRIIFQERWSNFEEYSLIGKDYYSLRTISILENCKHHPLFEEFVKLILELDKYSLEYDDSAVEKYKSYFFQTEGVSGIFANQYSDDVSGIRSFETVKLVNKLRKIKA